MLFNLDVIRCVNRQKTKILNPTFIRYHNWFIAALNYTLILYFTCIGRKYLRFRFTPTPAPAPPRQPGPATPPRSAPAGRAQQAGPALPGSGCAV